jgi:hypothetical protein
MEINIGKIKVIIDRQKQYIQLINFVMIGYLFLETVGFHWWYLLILPLWVLVGWIDLKYVVPKELEYWHGKSPILRRILNERKDDNFISD